MDARGILITTVFVIIAVMMATTITWEVPEVETYYTREPYTYEQSFIRADQIRKFPWIHKVTRVQYIVKNTDVNEGEFVLNFVFDNGEETETTTAKVRILPGEKRSVQKDSPLKGESSATLNVIPPNRSIPQERTVMRKVTVLDYIGLGWIPALFR